MDYISFDKERLKHLKKEYNKAVKAKQEQFTFDGHELLTSYAKYLIEYAETKLK